MNPIIGGALIGAGSSLLGGFLNKKFDNSAEIAKQNYEQQKEFAQNSIQWRVNDARQAGLHPLAALGTQGSYYTPSAQVGGDNMGQYVAQAGSEIGKAMQMLQLQNMQLQNDKLGAEIEGQKSDNMAKANVGFDYSKPEMRAGNAVIGLNQGVHKDDADIVSESLFGIGAVPELIRSLGDQYSWDPSRVKRNLEADFPGITNYFTLDYERNFSNAWRPSLKMEPNDAFFKLPRKLQKKFYAIAEKLGAFDSVRNKAYEEFDKLKR